MLFGDSLWEGCVDAQDGFSFYATLQKRECPWASPQSRPAHLQLLIGVLTDCLRRYDVVNRGFSGYNTSQALKIFEHLFPEPGPGTPRMEYLVSPSPSLQHACLPVYSKGET